MGQRHRRRSVLKGVVGVAAVAAAAAPAVAGSPASAAPSRRAKPGLVTHVTGLSVEVELDGGGTASVPAVGFPDGWRMRTGDVVMVMNSDADGSPDHALPFVTAVSGPFQPGPRSEAHVDGRRIRILPETVRNGERRTGGSHAVAFCMENRHESVLTATAVRFGG
ncbi:hypothetical protein [Streptomyces sp. 184]|uniref:hypothetical protein n=1 Tax=Streptomyces sp. 184 TaxID=1827526 RepID=UPI0038916050